jgi:hypothetical protein
MSVQKEMNISWLITGDGHGTSTFTTMTALCDH